MTMTHHEFYSQVGSYLASAPMNVMRYGQAVFNVASHINNKLATGFAGGRIDPYYDDNNVAEFVDTFLAVLTVTERNNKSAHRSDDDKRQETLQILLSMLTESQREYVQRSYGDTVTDLMLGAARALAYGHGKEG
jgi:hypothetical protein